MSYENWNYEEPEEPPTEEDTGAVFAACEYVQTPDIEENEFRICTPCLEGECEDCADSGIHAYPFWCSCARARHSLQVWEALE